MTEFLGVAGPAFLLIFLAEMGDKTQMVCVSLAARHNPWQVWGGATLAFLLLNALAVIFGHLLAVYLPERLLSGIVAALFLAFAWNSYRESRETEKDGPEEREPSRWGMVSAFVLIFMGELGDKTQLAVAGLASTQPALPIWVGASLALSTSSALAAWLGATVLKKVPPAILHRISAGLFLVFGVVALGKTILG